MDKYSEDEKSAGNRHTAAGRTDRLLFPGLPGMFTSNPQESRSNRSSTAKETDGIPFRDQPANRRMVGLCHRRTGILPLNLRPVLIPSAERGRHLRLCAFPAESPLRKREQAFLRKSQPVCFPPTSIVISSGTCVPPLLPTENSACGCIRIALFLFRCARVAEYDARFGHDAGTFFEFAIRFRLIGTLLHKKFLRY